MVSVALLEVYSSDGELVHFVDEIEARHLVQSGQVKRWHVKHRPCLRYYAGVDPDDGPLVMSPGNVHRGRGVRRERFFVPVSEILKRGRASGEAFEPDGVRLPDPARAGREREIRARSKGSSVPWKKFPLAPTDSRNP